MAERITWHLNGDAQASVTGGPDGTWSWHWSPAGTGKGKTVPGFTDRDTAAGAARTALAEAGITMEPKPGERSCVTCGQPLFDHFEVNTVPCCPGRRPGERR